ncbi:MAG: hypothetical protein HGB37_02535 [Candidatus Moranbacteria bacterium]|nr:hypothetical protein [Candidatus Moranbacteria bacterium]
MHTRSIDIRSVIISLLFIFLAACGQQAKTNSPEVAEAIQRQLDTAPRGSYLVGLNEQLSRMDSRPNEGKFVAQENSVHGKRHEHNVVLASKYVAKVVYPSSSEYASYDEAFYGGKILRSIYHAGQYALFIRNDGVIGRVSVPTQNGVLLVRWNDNWQSTEEDRFNLAAKLVESISVSDARYDKFSGMYTRNEKAPVPVK